MMDSDRARHVMSDEFSCITLLRGCETGRVCKACPYRGSDDCFSDLMKRAADLLEQNTRIVFAILFAED